jgi:hypothetical protein
MSGCWCLKPWSRLDRDGEEPALVEAAHLGDRRGQALEGPAQLGQSRRADLGQDEAPAPALDQRPAQRLLQVAHQLLDRGRGDVELVGGLAEAEVPGDRFEGPEGVQGGQPFAHFRGKYI